MDKLPFFLHRKSEAGKFLSYRFDPSVRKNIITMLAGALFIVITTWIAVSKFKAHSPDHQKLQLVVLPFRNLSDNHQNDEWGKSLQNMYASELTGVAGMGVFDPVSIDGFLENSFGTLQPARNEELNLRLKSTGATMVMDGNFEAINNGFRVQSRIIDPASGEVKFSLDNVVNSEEALASAVGKSSEQILDFFQVALFHSENHSELRPWLSQRRQNVNAVKEFIHASDLMYRVQPGADVYLRRALQYDSNYISARVWLISTLVGYGKLDEAKFHFAYLQRIQNSASPFEQAIINWAGAYINGDVSSQALQLQLALEYSPGNNILMYTLALEKYLMHDYAGAIKLMKPVIDMKWDYSEAWYLLGLCYDDLKDYPQAKAIFNQSLAIKNVYPDIYSSLCVLSYRDGDTAKNREYEHSFFLRMKEIGRTLPESYAMMGGEYAHSAFYQRAIENFHEAISLKPRIAEYHGELAAALFKAGNLDDALKECNETLRCDSQWVNVRYTIGRLLEMQHDTIHAVDQYRLYLRKDSTSAVADTVKTHLQKINH